MKSLLELEHIQKLFPDRFNLFAAFLDGKMIAGVVNFIVNDHVILAFYISHDEAFSKHRAVNLLFYTIFDWAIDNNYNILYFTSTIELTDYLKNSKIKYDKVLIKGSRKIGLEKIIDFL